MIRNLTKLLFSKQQYSFSNKITIFVKKEKKPIFEKRKNIEERIQKHDHNLIMPVEQKFQLQFERLKIKFNEAQFTELKSLQTTFLQFNIPRKPFYYFINTRFFKGQSSQCFLIQCQMINHFLNQYELLQSEIISVLNAIHHGLHFIDPSIQKKDKYFTDEEELYIQDTFLRLSNNLQINLDKNTKSICQIMKYTKIYNYQVLDKINQQLLEQFSNINQSERIYYTIILVKAGLQYFPEIIYKMRDEILTQDLINMDSKLLFEYFEIFGRSKLPLIQLAMLKIFIKITDNELFEKLDFPKRILLLYYASKSTIINNERIIPYIEQIMPNLNNVSEVPLKIFFLSLYNMNYNNLDKLRSYQTILKLKKKFEKLKDVGTFNNEELKYLDFLITAL